MNEQPTWAKVELMGHVSMAGKLSEEERFGAQMGRLDIPTTRPCVCKNVERSECDVCHGAGFLHDYVTQWFGGGSVYRITVVTEDVARHIAATNTPQPVSPWDFPKRLQAATEPKRDLYGDDDDDYDPRG